MVAEGTSKDLYFHRNLLIMTHAMDYVLWGYAKLIAWRETAMAGPWLSHVHGITKEIKNNPVEHRGDLLYGLRLYFFDFAKLA